jgi:hypothetical protein
MLFLFLSKKKLWVNEGNQKWQKNKLYKKEN